MANTRSAQKRVRTSAKRQAYNKAIKSEMKTAIKKFRAALEQEPDKATALLAQAASQIDRAANKGVIHKNQASRRKSRLASLAAKRAPAS